MDVEAIPDYRALIRRELRDLANPSEDDRRTVFQRVRDSLSTALQRSGARPAEENAAREIAALEDAIRDVESEFTGQAPSAPRGQTFRRLRVVDGGAKDESKETRAPRRAADPTLAAILEFQRPSLAIVNAPIPRAARGIAWTANDLHLEVKRGPASEEVMIPFQEMQQIQLRHKDAN